MEQAAERNSMKISYRNKQKQKKIMNQKVKENKIFPINIKLNVN